MSVLFRTLFVALLLIPIAVPAQTGITVTDIRGRTVTVPASGPRRILIDDGRYLVALSLIHDNPVSVLAAWPRDIHRISRHTYNQLKAKFPKIESVPQVASSAGSFSLEKALAVKPTVAVFTLNQGPSDDQLKQFEAAGIPVVFIDFFTSPLKNVDPSLKILGQITGRQKQAEEFIAFRRAHLKRITDRLAAASKLSRPRVFFETHAGMSEDCCNSPGKGNMGDYITVVGGHNIGADVLPGAFGRLNVEYVVGRNPDVYIATGGPHLEKAGGLVVGSGYSAQRARASLKAITDRTGISLLGAVKKGRVHGLSHQLLNSPLDILAVEAMARWIHPSLFANVNPAATQAEINKRFLAVPLEGLYWIDLR